MDPNLSNEPQNTNSDIGSSASLNVNSLSPSGNDAVEIPKPPGNQPQIISPPEPTGQVFSNQTTSTTPTTPAINNQPNIINTQSTSEYPTSQPQIIISPNGTENASATPTQPVTSVQQTYQPLTSESKTQRTRSFSIKLISLILIVLVVIAAGAVLIWMHFENKSGAHISHRSISVNVPSNWITYDSGFGYTVKAPPNWGLGFHSNDTVNMLQEKLITLSATGGNITFSTSGSSTTQSELNDSVTLGTQNLTSNNSQTNFDNAVSTLTSADKTLLKEFGLNPNSEKVVATDLNINGIPWLEVETSMSGQYSTSLYFWTKDHAISLEVANKSQQITMQLTNSYLLPMAASMKIKS